MHGKGITMRGLGSVLFLLLRLVCYAVLLLVILGFGSVVVLSLTGACPRIDTGAIVCTSDTYKQIGSFGMGVMLVTAFTGIPALMAIAGVFFLVRKIYLWRTARAAHPLAAGPDDVKTGSAQSHSQPSEGGAARQSTGIGMFILKAIGVVLGVLFLIGFIGGILGGGL